jgi:serine/threonine-protein kinase RsbW
MASQQPASSAPALRGLHTDDLVAALPAVPASLAQARTLVQEWLSEQGWPAAAAEDIVLAVNEAAANVVDHAYPPTTAGSLHLHAWVSVEPRIGTRRIVAAVTDRGRWRSEHRATALSAYRGYGLLMMSGCTAEMHIQRSAGGTTVILIGHSIPRPLSPT